MHSTLFVACSLLFLCTSVWALDMAALSARQRQARMNEGVGVKDQLQQEASHTTQTAQGVVTTHTMEFKNQERRVGQQENVYDDKGDGKNGEGGTSVILSNLNSVENWEDNRMERDLALEAARKRGQEQKNKEDYGNSQREQSAKNRQETVNEDKAKSKQKQEQKEKREDEAERRRLAEHKKKREDRDEQSEKRSRQREEQTAKRMAETEKEEKDKREKREEQEAKRRQEREEDELASFRTVSFKPTTGMILRSGGDISSWTQGFTYMFFVKPGELVSDWSNLFHKGQDNVNRNPAVWFYPGDRRLHVRSGTAQNPTWWNGGNNGCDPTLILQKNVWYHVAMVHDGTGLRVYINAELACQANIGGPVANNGPLYVGDPWHSATTAVLADFRYYPRAVPFSKIQQAYLDRKGVA